MKDEAERISGADWVVRRDEGLTPAEQEAYQRWLEADASHRDEVDRLASTWEELGRPLRTGGADAVLREIAACRRRRVWRQWSTATVGLAAAAAAVLVWSHRPVRPGRVAPAASSVVESRPVERILSDGSIVDLRDGAEISVEFTPAARRVVLQSGEALFQVAKNHQWPFIVQAGGVEVRAVGTAFSVDFGSRNVEILVKEGRVAVAQKPAAGGEGQSAAAAPTLVGAGNQAVVDPLARAGGRPEVRPMSESQIRDRLSWSEPRLEFSGTPLPEAVELLNRRNLIKFVIDDPSLKSVKLSGYIRSGNIEGFVSMLEGSFGIRAERRSDSSILLRRSR